MSDIIPYTFVTTIQEFLKDMMTDHLVVRRRLSPTDSSKSIGIFPKNGEYTDASLEIGSLEPTLITYHIQVQHLTKAADREYAQQLSMNNSKVIRVLLYRTESLRVKLTGNNEVLLGSTERFKRLRVGRQNLDEAKIKSSYFFLTTTEVSIMTETQAA